MSNKEKQIYQANRDRVFEIYGIDPKDRRYSAHHIIFRSDFEKPNNFPEGYQDSKANLYPLTIEEHERLHKKIEEREGHIIYQAHRKRRKPKKKEFSGKNPNEE